MSAKQSTWTNNVELEIEAALKLIGGERVDKAVHGPNAPENADFYVPAYNVLVEVKELDVDIFEPKENLEKLQKLLKAEKERNPKLPIRLAPDGVNYEINVNLPGWSQTFQDGFRDIARRQLERVIEKSNSQLKKTITELHLQNVKTMVIIVNNGRNTLEPATAMHLLFSILNSPFYRSINTFFYMSVRLPAIHPNEQGGVAYWADGIREIKPPEEAIEPVDPAFMGAFRDAWQKHIITIPEFKNVKIKDVEPKEMRKLRNVNPPVIAVIQPKNMKQSQPKTVKAASGNAPKDDECPT